MSFNHRAFWALLVLHFLAASSIAYIYFYGVTLQEIAVQIVLYFLGGFGITALYHRSWAHNAVVFSRPVEYVLAACSTLVIQLPASRWIADHIAHHQHTDSDQDPYNIGKGFWWAHFEWILWDQTPVAKLPERLQGNPAMIWQEKFYWPISFATNIALPIGLSIVMSTPWIAALLLSALRMTIMEHAIFSVNSVCHYWGTQPFEKSGSAKNVWWFPLALGEQYHNYHHAFPRDYRHGLRVIDFDPTKWLIFGLYKIGLAQSLVTMSNRRIRAAQIEAETHN